MVIGFIILFAGVIINVSYFRHANFLPNSGTLRQ